MNEGYIKLSDNNIAVTDENGNITKKSHCNCATKSTLLLENKIEQIDKKISQINNKIGEYKGVIFLANGMMIASPLIVIGVALGTFCLTGLTTQVLEKAIYDCIGALEMGVIVGGIAEIYCACTKPKVKKKIKGYTKQIERAEELKEGYEDELKEIKEKQNSLSDSVAEINQPISLKQDNVDIINTIDHELNCAYNSEVKNKPKVFTKTRKN